MKRLLAILTLAIVTASAASAQEVEEMSLGDENAPVTVIEYASFTCPHCRTFHEGAFQQLKADYIDTGQVEFVLREVYFDRFGLWAGMVARCSGDEERYFAIVDLIFERQAEWTEGNSPAEIAQNLRRLGLSAGLEEAQLDACMQDAAKAEALVAAYQENAAADGIESTPSFVIGGETYSNMPFEDFAQILDEQLGE